jgi:D-alanine-D-alanine ligase
MARAGWTRSTTGLALGRGARADVSALGLPLWVKPARLGSSVGIVKVADAGGLGAALAQAWAHDPG